MQPKDEEEKASVTKENLVKLLEREEPIGLKDTFDLIDQFQIYPEHRCDSISRTDYNANSFFFN